MMLLHKTFFWLHVTYVVIQIIAMYHGYLPERPGEILLLPVHGLFYDWIRIQISQFPDI